MRRVFVISDLHLGGSSEPMLGHPERLVAFLDALARLSRADGLDVELVINGDFIDFLAEAPSAAWTATEEEAVTKLKNIVNRLPELFAAFRRANERLDKLTILLGNHDLELAYPRVRELLFESMGTSAHRCLFISNNEAYQVGDVLIEHGNRYDSWNAIDHDGLRQLVSCGSRGETPPREVAVCPGSNFVHEVMNPLKARYAFVDLLKPEDKVVALLLSEFEPGLKSDLGSIFSFATAFAKQIYRRATWRLSGDGIAPTDERLVSVGAKGELNAKVAAQFEAELALERGEVSVSVGRRLRKLFVPESQDSLSKLLREGAAIPADRLVKLQVALAQKLSGDTTFEESGDDGFQVAAARNIVAAKRINLVIMGHTHLRRELSLDGGSYYVNTGTWADLLRVAPENLIDTEEGLTSFTKWLRQLVTNDLSKIRRFEGAYADVLLKDDLTLATAGPFMRPFTGTTVDAETP